MALAERILRDSATFSLLSSSIHNCNRPHPLLCAGPPPSRVSSGDGSQQEGGARTGGEEDAARKAATGANVAARLTSAPPLADPPTSSPLAAAATSDTQSRGHLEIGGQASGRRVSRDGLSSRTPGAGVAGRAPGTGWRSSGCGGRTASTACPLRARLPPSLADAIRRQGRALPRRRGGRRVEILHGHLPFFHVAGSGP
jgi:hypothetical protein